MKSKDEQENENPFLKAVGAGEGSNRVQAVAGGADGQVSEATVRAMALGDRPVMKAAGGATAHAASLPSDGGRMEAVVDLLFGNHLKEINDGMRALEKQVTERISKAEGEMAVRIDTIDRHTKREVDTLNKLLEKERSARQDAVGKLNDRIDSAVRQIEARLEKMEGEITKRHVAAQRDIDERMTQAAESTRQLRDEMETEVADLRHTLSTRAELSGMFSELGKRLGAKVDGSDPA